MKQITETYHTLEILEDGKVWCRIESGTYREAFLLAYYGRLSEAIELAERTRIESYGHMHGVRFRVVTTTKTITVNAGEFE